MGFAILTMSSSLTPILTKDLDDVSMYKCSSWNPRPISSSLRVFMSLYLGGRGVGGIVLGSNGSILL